MSSLVHLQGEVGNECPYCNIQEYSWYTVCFTGFLSYSNVKFYIIVIRAQCGVYEIYKPEGPGCSAQAKQGCY